jgi:hypothetical protein
MIVEVVGLTGGRIGVRAPCPDTACRGYAEVITLKLPEVPPIPIEEGQYVAGLAGIKDGEKLRCIVCRKWWRLVCA